MRLADETVVVTGAGSGIGRATAERCAGEGATVVVTDIDGDGGRETVSRIEDRDGTALFRELDVTDPEAVSALLNGIDDSHGLDVLVNNAGVSHPRKDMEAITDEEFEWVLDVNVRGVWNGCRAAVPLMKKRGEGVIVNTASIGGIIGAPHLSAYTLTKGAVVNFTRTLAAEVGPHGIRANAVCPAITETPLAKRGADSETEWDHLADRMAQQYPLRRLGQPTDIANCFVFLASEEAAWVTGHALVVDGGFSCA